MNLVHLIAPELVLVAVACVLFLLGVSNRAASRRLSAAIAFVTLVAVFLWQLSRATGAAGGPPEDEWHTVVVGGFATYVKMMVAGVGAVLALLAWPANREATGSAALDFGRDAGEFFGLMLLSLAGVMLVAGANDLILLFLGIELASIPTYIMVSISRPLPAAQEAGVKYFFLGAMAAAVMLFGFSYLYGTTGLTKLTDISQLLHPALPPVPADAKTVTAAQLGWGQTSLTTWGLLGVVVLLAGFAFKIAAVPFHAYAGDVYQGAATPVTALLAFVPKTSGFVAILKVLFAVGGPHWALPPLVANLLVVVAAVTMSIGNVLGLLQYNVKRVLAYSSIAHSGYMLVAVAAVAHAASLAPAGETPVANLEQALKALTSTQESAVSGILYYLAAYGLMNAGAFGILMLLPSRANEEYGAPATPPPATTAETFEDIAGTGRRHPMLGLGMAVCCFSLIGLPLTAGFFGKVYLIKPALDSRLYWLVGITMANAAVSAAYYLRIVATMYLRPAPEPVGAGIGSASATRSAEPSRWAMPMPIAAGVAAGVLGTLVLGIVLRATNGLTEWTRAAQLTPAAGTGTAAAAPPAVPATVGGTTPTSPQAAAR